MAPSTSNLKQLLEYQSKCERLEMFDGQGQLVLIVTQFIIKLRSENDEIIILLKSLEDSAKVCWSYTHHSEEDRKFSTLFWEFIAQLQIFFQVPKFESTSKPNELVAAFVDLLLEILEEVLHLQPYFINGLVENFIITQKELKFIITFLGDTPSRLTEVGTTKNVMIDIEVVVDKVGSFLYSFFFSKCPISIAAMNKSLSDLLRNVELLKESIKEHCVSVANIWPSTGMTPKTAVASLFFVDSILDYMEGLVHHNDDRIVDVKENLMNLVNGMKELLVECKEFSMPLINIAYEVEYIINSFAPVWYITLRLLQVTENIESMRKKLLQEKEESEMKYRLVRGTSRLQLMKNNDVGMLKEFEYPRQRISWRDHIVVEEEYLVGLKEEESEIQHRLRRGQRRLEIISITGMPGLGKTTLANKLYNDPMIRDYFHKMAWCVVSQTYPQRNILIDILASVSGCDGETILNMEDSDLKETLYKCLKGLRYIIFLDDLRDVNAWDGIRKCFPDDNCGSRILFTSPIMMKLAIKDSFSIHNYTLHFPTKDEFWKLLQLKVLFREEYFPPELVDIGKKIASNCSGLPITVVMISSVLKYAERTKSFWMKVAENTTSFISNEYFKNMLELSYYNLPMHLKPCFLYFGVFEKGQEIPVQKLIMLWDAERFIREVKDKSSEDVANEYLMELIYRNILRVSERKSDGGIKSLSIHGAMHDMCLRLANEENFVKVIKDQSSIYEQHNRLCFHSQLIPSFSRPFGLHIHSLFGRLPDPPAFIFSSLKDLKVLDLSTVDLSLYNLKGNEVFAFLRFLAVSSIPSSIEIFKNLEFLFVDNKEVVEIPAILLNMVKLRHVHFSGGAQFGESWRQAPHDKRSNVQNLSSIFIYDENDEKILRLFSSLRILKCKLTVFWDSSWNRYCYPTLCFLNHLESLTISLRPSYESADISHESISLPINIRKLTLRKFDFSTSFMTAIGKLRHLEVLKLRDNTMEGKQWDTYDDEFCRLKYLELDNVKIKLWNASYDHFPILEILVLRSCHFLETIPLDFADIPTLEKIEVHGCSKSAERSALKIKEEQEELGNYLKVIISSS